MKRAPIVLSATAMGLAAVLTFRTHDLASSTPSTATTVARAAAGASPTTTGSGTRSPDGAGGSVSTTTVPSTATPSTTSTPSLSGSATGRAEETRYGVVQVRVTVAGGRITAVTAVELSASDPHSEQINAEAVPQLRAEVLSAQSAHIDGVSGATFTSEGYEASLQSALDTLGFTS